MPDSHSRLSAARLTLVPAVVTLAITILRLVGELQHWSKVLFNPEAGGGFALVGITWLAPLFGIYFAVKLVRNGQPPPSLGRAAVFALLAAVVGFGGAFAPVPIPATALHEQLLYIWGVAVVAALIALPAWPALYKVLLGYAYAARIPVAIIMFLAFHGHWGTHYDAAPAGVGFASVNTEYLWLGFFPQLIFWIGYTLVLGALFGVLAAAVMRSKGQSEPIRQPA